MNYTTNFNLNKPEGTDLYNHLTVDNPNMDTIDAAMQANKLASVGAATELVSGTVHAITRSDSNQNIFKFKATGDFKAGDTVTVDGVSVNAYTTGGQPLLDDAYVLSAEVLCILDNTSLWVLVNKEPDASDVPYDNTTSGLVANEVQTAIDKTVERTKFLTDNVSIYGDGSTTNLVVTRDVSRAGYTPLGIVGTNSIGSLNMMNNLHAYYIQGTDLIVGMLGVVPNNYGIRATILYQKN